MDQTPAQPAAVVCSTFDEVLHVAETCAADPRIGAEIKELYIDIPWMFEGPSGEESNMEEDAPDALEAKRLPHRFLDTLVNLEVLFVVGISCIASAALDAARAPRRFRRLHTLHLHSEFEGITDPFHASHFATLTHFPHLRQVSLFVEWCIDSMDRQLDPLPALPPLPNITTLALHGPLSRKPSSTSLLSVFPSFTSLLHLTLRDTYVAPDSSWSAILLAALPNPPLLRSLSFHREWHKEPHDISGALPFFRNLRHVGIGGVGMAVKPGFFASISVLPVTELRFGPDVKGLSTADLSRLVKADRPPLQRIVLDNLTDDSVWSHRFSPGGLQTLVRAARKEGIEVKF
ncbi:hypothetical protein JCM6882_005071 [Rhodosporidiobolus microsporus]